MNTVQSKGFGTKGSILLFYMFLCYFVNTSINTGWQNCLSYWQENYGWDTSTLLSLVSVAQFVGIAFYFIVGRLLLKKSARMLAIICASICVIGCFSINMVHSMALFGIIEMVTILAEVVLAFTINPTFVASWFPRKKGIVMGIVTIGIPLGAGTVSKVMNAISASFGKNYCLYYCGIIALIALILLIFVVRDYPEQAGAKPDNDENMSTEEVRRLAAEQEEMNLRSPWTVSRTLKCPQTYLIGISIGLCALAGGGIMGTNVLHMLEMGYDVKTAVNMMLFAAAAACFWSYFFGWIDSKFGARTGMIWVGIGAILCPIFHIFGKSMPMLIIALILTGVISGGAANFLTSTLIEYWGPANFKRVYSVIFPIHQIPAALGVGYMAQVSKHAGYNAAYIGLCIMMVISLIMYASVKNGDFAKEAEAKWAAEDKAAE